MFRHPALLALLALGTIQSGAAVQAADWLAPFKLFGEKEALVVWQAPGAYVKIVEQDRFRRYQRPPANDHPATVSANDIAAVLASLKTGAGESSTGDAPLFSAADIAQVASKIAESLGKAQPRQDIIFAVSGTGSKAGELATAARVFVEDGRLNIILGDTMQPGGGAIQVIDHEQAPWRPGRRRESMDTAHDMAGGAGISFRPGFRDPRYDWAIIEIRTLVAAYRGPQIPLATEPGAGVSADTGDEINARSLQERQQMRLEMARMRKQLESQQGDAAAVPPPAPNDTGPASAPGSAVSAGTTGATAPVDRPRSPAPAPADAGAAAAAPPAAGAKSVEQRLSILQALHEKKLITDEEYAAKRKQILDEL
jgi:hypothetical protein